MKLLLVIAVLFVVAQASSVQEQWQQFKLNHGKTYKSLLEEKRRFAIFQKNLVAFEEHNAKFARGEVSYTVGPNNFADWTEEELKTLLSPIETRPPMSFTGIHNATTSDLGTEIVNWVTKGYVTPSVSQETCVSGWAFSTVGGIEGQVAKNGGGLVPLSAQNLVDCVEDNNGCHGGSLVHAFRYVQENGVPTAAGYPYTGRDGKCSKSGGQKISGIVAVARNEAALLNALSTVGPISASMDGSTLGFYMGGILDNSSGCTTAQTHGVLIVGAGTEDGKDYWLIRNSWGVKWGEGGLFKLARGQNACGIQRGTFYPTL